jgi:hypothetical protein
MPALLRCVTVLCSPMQADIPDALRNLFSLSLSPSLPPISRRLCDDHGLATYYHILGLHVRALSLTRLAATHLTFLELIILIMSDDERKPRNSSLCGFLSVFCKNYRMPVLVLWELIIVLKVFVTFHTLF